MTSTLKTPPCSLVDINLRLQNDKNPAETDQNHARELSKTYDDAVRQYFDSSGTLIMPSSPGIASGFYHPSRAGTV
ncbi:MAG: hypothetical protein R2861_16450 [Desulfobacterales bacterium]